MLVKGTATIKIECDFEVECDGHNLSVAHAVSQYFRDGFRCVKSGDNIPGYIVRIYAVGDEYETEFPMEAL